MSLLSSATQGNASLGDLVNELNTSLNTALSGSAYSGLLAFRASGSALTLTASGSSITSLAIDGAIALGFSASQTSNNDIQLSLHDGQQFAVSLKGASTPRRRHRQFQTASETLSPSRSTRPTSVSI